MVDDNFPVVLFECENNLIFLQRRKKNKIFIYSKVKTDTLLNLSRSWVMHLRNFNNPYYKRKYFLKAQCGREKIFMREVLDVKQNM
jgi:hypothetical protein